MRFCRCSPALGDRCHCTQSAINSSLEAVHCGMHLFGISDGEHEPVDVPRAPSAGATLSYDKDGLRLLPRCAIIHVPVAEVLRRWPAGFEDRPTSRFTAMPNEPEEGRGDAEKKVAAL